tara:strand:- start:433 stop:654 length:222 start_codon:yes stop_codon:yes gene_type:complete
MKTIESISTGEVFEGDEIEYFIDDDTQIGEVYLDGDLIYQSLETMNEDQLERAFRQEFKVIEQPEDIFSNFND